MNYLLLIYTDENREPKSTPEQAQAMRNDYIAFTQDIAKSGHYKGGDALQPTATATTVRVRDGKTQLTHGPFAETREQLGGYYMVDAKDLDEAAAIAARIPGARIGSIEIRPIMKVM